MRAIVETDAPEIVQAFERLSANSRYFRFMQHKKQLSDSALQRGVNPRPGREFALVRQLTESTSLVRRSTCAQMKPMTSAASLRSP